MGPSLLASRWAPRVTARMSPQWLHSSQPFCKRAPLWAKGATSVTQNSEVDSGWLTF
jgi:hypothetical protein